MEIVGGFMVMMSIISLFLAVVWLIMPFVVFAIKGKQDRTLEVLEAIEMRLAALEARIQTAEPERSQAGSSGNCDHSAESTCEPSDESPCEHTIKNAAARTESADDKKGTDVSPAV